MTDKIIKYHLKEQVLKFNEDRQQVFGMANLAVLSDGQIVEDLHGDIIHPDVLEKAAYDFVLEYRDTGVMHEGTSTGRLIESFMATPEKISGLLKSLGVPPDALPAVASSAGLGWWVGFQIDDPAVFKRVKAGELKMFSIQGTATKLT